MVEARESRGTADALEGGAIVAWQGDLKDGEGRLRFGHGAGGELMLRWPGSPLYGPGATSPEELAAASHAACFTLTLAYTLARQQRPARAITAEAKTTFGAAAGIRMIRRSQLEITVDVDGVSEAELGRAAELAGRYCPVSNSFRIAGAELDVRAHLKSA